MLISHLYVQNARVSPESRDAQQEETQLCARSARHLRASVREDLRNKRRIQCVPVQTAPFIPPRIHRGGGGCLCGSIDVSPRERERESEGGGGGGGGGVTDSVYSTFSSSH